jgi:hypothetical protein
MAQAAGQARRLAPFRELALASQVVKAQECPAAAYQGRGCQTWQFYPAIGGLEAEHMARRPAGAPHDPMGCRLLERSQALEAQAMAPATRGHPVSDHLASTFRSSRSPCKAISMEAFTRAAVPRLRKSPR